MKIDEAVSILRAQAGYVHCEADQYFEVDGE